MEIPELEKKIRSEYNKYTERQHMECVYEYLFLQNTFRDIDESVLKLDKDKTNGYQSNAILGTIGLNDKHKKYFKDKLEGLTIEEGINVLVEIGSKEYEEIIRLLDKLNKSRENHIKGRTLTKSKNDINSGLCWKFTKQIYDFEELCNRISEIFNLEAEEVVEEAEEVVEEVEETEEDLNNTSVPKALVGAKIYGLLKKDGNNNIPSPIFKLILNRVGSDFNNKDRYKDIIEQQIEKIYYSGPIVRGKEKKEFSLYIVLFLYKILIEIGKSTGRYEISDKEFYLWVTTSRVYEDWEDTVRLIINSRNLDEVFKKEEDTVFTYLKNNNKTDIRVGSILRHLYIFDETSLNNYIYKIKDEYIKSIATKVKIFEFINRNLKGKNAGAIPNGNINVDEYLDFLTSDITMIPRL